MRTTTSDCKLPRAALGAGSKQAAATAPCACPGSATESLPFDSLSPNAAAAVHFFRTVFCRRECRRAACAASRGKGRAGTDGILARWLRALSLSGAKCCY